MQVKILALALGVKYQDLISGAAGYTGIRIKNVDQQTKIQNVFIRRNKNASN